MSKELDIGYTQGYALLVLDEFSSMVVADMADRLTLDISTESRIVN